MRQREIAYPDSPIRRSVVEVFAIPSQALRLLWRHLPQLITAVCLGLAGRQAVIWIAVGVSSFSSLAAMLIMPLAPACVMASMIFAFWFVQPSLFHLGNDSWSPPRQASQSYWLSVGTLLVPFLGAYSTHGMLGDDLTSFRYAATTTEIINRGYDADTSRSFINDLTVLVVLVGVTIILRRVVGYVISRKGPTHLLALFSAYLEVLWMATGSAFLTRQIERWVTNRRNIAPTVQNIRDISSGLSSNTDGLLLQIAAWISIHWPLLLQFVAVPTAWLTLAVLVLGTSAAPNCETGQQPRPLSSRSSLPSVMGTFKATWRGLRVLAQPGLFSVALFCLIFTLTNFVEIGVIHLGRAMVGPLDVLASEVAASYILIAAKTAYLVVVVCLVASAVDYFSRPANHLESSSS
ncbi:hypothetical protein CAFEA_01620 [Corynebacterium afermentans subsp. afermentans]|uniref:Uncharacterized protein n=1 Tax=Corynebacterium afermentans TaxID=38286 RepID=A0A9X8WID2_9CORY|nr:hypothetical protein [Corynebacterium afermentans]WJY55947.1 hypothetical protein CAFEA_01620 [Corynebacterium afermentans subsp. afermentans]SIQ37268.1 hypothetical protein SAMN05421802_11271 [Corynebacterium afermentans]